MGTKTGMTRSDIVENTNIDAPVSYAIGTIVRLKPESSRDLSFTDGIVDDVSIDTGNIEYSVQGCSWFQHSDLEFIAHPTAETLDTAISIHLEEEGENYEDDEE